MAATRKKATTRKKLQATASPAQEIIALKQRVAALEQHCADKEAVDTLARAQRKVEHDERKRERVRERLELAARNARWSAIDEFNRRYWDARLPGSAALRREKLEELNAYLMARGMDPEPVR